MRPLHRLLCVLVWCHARRLRQRSRVWIGGGSWFAAATATAASGSPSWTRQRSPETPRGPLDLRPVCLAGPCQQRQPQQLQLAPARSPVKGACAAQGSPRQSPWRVRPAVVALGSGALLAIVACERLHSSPADLAGIGPSRAEGPEQSPPRQRAQAPAVQESAGPRSRRHRQPKVRWHAVVRRRLPCTGAAPQRTVGTPWRGRPAGRCSAARRRPPSPSEPRRGSLGRAPTPPWPAPGARSARSAERRRASTAASARRRGSRQRAARMRRQG
mmetsp:Transcript_9607/g.28373  ORF Transcript_9607/g.28373 Transcript_9607/m.28373 type:complete len:272 (-) Transcript_9607:208-1023(-)